MSSSLKSDADLKKKAEAFFALASEAVCNDVAQFSRLTRQGRFLMYKNIAFDVDASVAGALHELIAKSSKLLGPKIAHEEEISDVAWECAFQSLVGESQTSDEKEVTKRFLDELLKHTQRCFQWIAPNHVILFRERVRRLQIGPVEAIAAEELRPELNDKLSLTTIAGKEFAVIDGDADRVLQLPPVCWRVSVHAAKGHVEEEATWLINIALSLLRLSCPTSASSGFGNIEAHPVEEHNFRKHCGLKMWDDNIEIRERTRLGLYEINDATIAISNSPEFLARTQVIFDPSKNSLAERFVSGLGWLSRGRQTADRAERFLFFFTAIEALLSSEDKTSPVVQTIVRYISVILVDDVKMRSQLAKTIKTLYEARSGLVHGGKRNVSILEMNTLQHIAELLYFTVMNKTNLEIKFDQFQTSLSEASYGLVWPLSSDEAPKI